MNPAQVSSSFINNAINIIIFAAICLISSYQTILTSRLTPGAHLPMQENG